MCLLLWHLDDSKITIIFECVELNEFICFLFLLVHQNVNHIHIFIFFIIYEKRMNNGLKIHMFSFYCYLWSLVLALSFLTGL